MFSLVAIATVCAFAIAQPGAAVEDPAVRVLFTGLAMAAVVAAATLANLTRPSTTRPGHRDDDAHLWDSMSLVIWAVMSLFSVQVMRWPALVRWKIGEQVPLLDEFAILLSFLLPLFAAWMILWQSPSGGSSRLQLRGRLASAWLRMRFTLVLALLPLLLICCAGDCLARFWPDISASHRSAVYIGCLVAMIALFPVVIRALWTAKPLGPGDLRCRLQQMASRHDIRLADIYVWYTGGSVANAFVTGVMAPMRYVFLTDRLLAELEDDHIVLAFAHELGHVVKRHLILRALALLAPLAIMILLSHPISTPTPEAAGRTDVFAMGRAFELGSVSLTVLFMFCGLGWYSRQLEHQADLWACLVGVQVADEASDSVATAIGQALSLGETVERYGSALVRLADPRYIDRNGWLHPGYMQRCRFLQQCISNSRRTAAFSARMNFLAAALYLLTASAIVSLAVSLWFG